LTMDATIIHVQPTAPSATQEAQSPLSQPVTEVRCPLMNNCFMQCPLTFS